MILTPPEKVSVAQQNVLIQQKRDMLLTILILLMRKSTNYCIQLLSSLNSSGFSPCGGDGHGR
jgi:hypothetical protein